MAENLKKYILRHMKNFNYDINPRGQKRTQLIKKWPKKPTYKQTT